MIELDRSEAIRYMGYHGTQPDEAVQASLTRCGEALQQAAEPKSIYRVFPLQHIDAQTLEIADVQIHSKNLARNLQGCSEVCLMAATLGIGPDRLIARASAVRMSDAVIYQAAAAAMVETYCDEVNERIRQEAAGSWTPPWKPLSAACTVDRGSVPVTVIFRSHTSGISAACWIRRARLA